jgi:hypothetical protein
MPDGRKIMAGLFTSTKTSYEDNIVGQTITTEVSSYFPGSIVVLGQVITTNDNMFSYFWSSSNPIHVRGTRNYLQIGKGVSKDTDITRNNEVLGYIVMEEGHRTASGMEVEARVTSGKPHSGWLTSTLGATTYYESNYSTIFTRVPKVVIAMLASASGGDGGWAVLVGAPYGKQKIRVAVDEDDIYRPEARWHVFEDIAYAAFTAEGTLTLVGNG